MRTIWILGDQLLQDNAALLAGDKKCDVVLMVESKARGKVLPYHKQKLVLIYAAMRHYAEALAESGWQVDYVRLEEGLTFGDAATRHFGKCSSTSISLAQPNSLFETDAFEKLGRKLGIPVEFQETNQFLCGRREFVEWAGSKTRLVMENHYRRMRVKTGYLVGADGSPEGGQWNYDPENRETFRDWKNSSLVPPNLPRVEIDETTSEVIAMVETNFPDNPGSARAFWIPVTHAHAKEWLEIFIRERLPHFGSFEDILVEGHGVLYHSVLSPLLNIGLLSPAQCAEAAIAAYNAGNVPLNAAEGFVRQIIGWREFINGIYWLRGPSYRELNALQAERPLPTWFYNGEVPMNCMSQVLKQLVDTGWNHHIQRLMILGNFILLAGIRPQEALRWFSEMYIDAYDWVMVANVIGMICHADGGYMATKPYAAGSAYIQRMSNYCEGCSFSPKIKTGPKACPFNYLYWNFFDNHSERFSANPRVSMPIRSWLKREVTEQEKVRESSHIFLSQFVPATTKS